jgi:hypothetical protein
MRLLTRAHHNAPRVCTSVLSRLFCRLPLVGMEKLQAALLVFLGSVSTLIAGASVLYMGVFYTGLYGGASIHLKLPHHLPALFVRSYPVVNNLLLLAVFFGTHRCLVASYINPQESVCCKCVT